MIETVDAKITSVDIYQYGIFKSKTKVYTSVDSVRMVKIGAHEFHGWLFEHKWEMVPGQYSFQIFDHHKELGKKTFTGYLP